MDERTARLESAVDRLQLTVLSLDQRLEALEARVLAGATLPAATGDGVTPDGAALAPPPRARTKDPYDPIAILSLVGRLLLVLAGGFFLRAVTEAGFLADPVGIALAFVYATLWLFMSDRAGARGQVPSAVFHALACAMTAFPLIVEATTRFKVLTGPTAAGVLALLSAGLLFVAWHRQLRAVMWIAVLGALGTAAVVLIQTGVVVPFAIVLIALGVASLWLSHPTGWWGPRWPAALAADAAVAAVTLRAFAPEHRDTPEMAMLLQGLLLLAYLGSIALRTLVRHQGVSRFEIVQTAAALVVGVGGGVVMARATGAIPAVVGVAAVLVGLACYGIALAVIGRREAGTINFYFYTTLALALVLAGFAIALDTAWAGALFALFAVLAAGLWARSGQLFALLHGGLYLAGAAIASGALGYSTRALVVVAGLPAAGRDRSQAGDAGLQALAPGHAVHCARVLRSRAHRRAASAPACRQGLRHAIVLMRAAAPGIASDGA